MTHRVGLALVAAFYATVSCTQTPTPPSPSTPTTKTKLEAFEAQAGVVIVQGFSQAGELRSVDGGSVSVVAKEWANATSGKRESGIVIKVKEAGGLERENRSFVDYDEIDPLVKGLDYIAKLDKSVTKLDHFQADYRTKGDLFVSTFDTGSGETMVSISSGTIGAASSLLMLPDLTKLRELITNAKAKLDAIR